MAENSPITADDEWFIGTDHQFEFGPVVDGDGVAIDVSTWTLSWMMKRRLNDPDLSAILTKTPTVTGTHNPDPALSTQRVVVSIADTDTDPLVARVDYRHELKRTDAGSEAVLAYGTAVLKRGVHRT